MTRRRRFRALAVALVALFCLSAFTQTAHAEPARLIIYRSPTFGNIQWLRIWIDGVEVEAVGYGHDFRTSLAPGRHVIAVRQSGPTWPYPPTRRVLKVNAGQTYAFTAVWLTDDRVFLQEGR